LARARSHRLDDLDLCVAGREHVVPAVLDEHRHLPAGLVGDGEGVPEQNVRPVREPDDDGLPGREVGGRQAVAVLPAPGL
jgi:hypothetical protein